MSTEMDSPMPEVMRHMQNIQSALDDQLHQLNTESFDGLDEARTVAVTLDGRRHAGPAPIELGPTAPAAPSPDGRAMFAFQLPMRGLGL